jgi:aminopeptidase N
VENVATDQMLITQIMDPWTTQPGYPYVNVTVKGDTLEIVQKRFLVKDAFHLDNTSWPIPLTFATKKNEFEVTKPVKAHIYYKEDGAKKTIKLASSTNDFVVLNNQQTGYYRVNYDTDSWTKIKNILKSKRASEIHVLNRAQIVDDLFNLARGGLVDYYFALDIVDYMRDEKAYPPWVATFNGLSFLSRRLTTQDDGTLLRSYVLDLLKNIYEHLGYLPKEGDKHTDVLNRVNVLSWLCRYGHEECLEKTRNEWQKFVAQVDAYE